MLESGALGFRGLALRVCQKKTVGVRTHSWQQSQRAQTGQGFSRRIHTGQFQNQGSRVRPSRSSAEAVLDPARREKEVQSTDPRREKENQPAPESQIQHHPGSPIRHKQEERSRPDYGQRWRPAKPDAGPLIKAGFYRADQTMVDL